MRATSQQLGTHIARSSENGGEVSQTCVACTEKHATDAAPEAEEAPAADEHAQQVKAL